MPRIPHLLAALVFALVVNADMAKSQDAPKPEPRLCFRGRPLPKCNRFVLTEIGVYRKGIGTERKVAYPETLNSPTYSYTVPSTPANMITWEFGGMVNVDSSNAFGGTLVMGTGLAQVGIKARYRRWLTSDGISLDIATGIASGSSQWTSRPTITSDIALNASDYGAVLLRVDVARVAGQTGTGLYGGFRLGSRPAIFGTASVGLAFAVLVAIVSQID